MPDPRFQAAALAALWKGLQLLAGFRTPKAVTELFVFPVTFGTSSNYVCPQCGAALDREFMTFCNSCGQRLDWEDCENATVVYSNQFRT